METVVVQAQKKRGNQMPILDHTHTYRRVSPNVYLCAHPDCNHREAKKFLKGKRSICCQQGCENEIILTAEHLQRAEPKCFEHSNTKSAREFKKSVEILKGLGVDI